MLAQYLNKIDLYKTEIDKFRPFKDQKLLKELYGFYCIGLTYSSNALEGNSLSLSETKIILENGITIGGKPLKDTLEAVGHAKAFDFMFSLINNDSLSLEDIYKMHELFYLSIDKENAGILRKQNVFISGSNHNDKIPNWQDLFSEMKKFEDWMIKARQKTHPAIFAAEVHSKLIKIHLQVLEAEKDLMRMLHIDCLN